MKLSAAKIRALSAAGMYGDGGGLYLRVAPGGSKQWIYRAAIGGKRRAIGLGGYPAVSLAKARDKAQANRAAIADGRNPLAEKRRAPVPTFEAAALAYHAANLPRWRSDRHGKQWLASVARYAFPVIGDVPVDRIEAAHVLRILTPIWAEKSETARYLRGRIRSVLQWAQAHGHVSHNPAGEMIGGALPPMPRLKAHRRALPYAEIADALDRIDAAGIWIGRALCLRFVALTAARSGEARGATWGEMDTAAREWRVPGARMKMARPHRVPLSDAALAVLEAARPLRSGDGGGALVFPSQRGKVLTDHALSKPLRDNEIDGTVHGLRSGFRDWCAETGKLREIAEAALAHTVGGVEGAYFRSDLFEARRRLMADWARYLAGESAKVVALHG